jgi:hypothetical protein
MPFVSGFWIICVTKLLITMDTVLILAQYPSFSLSALISGKGGLFFVIFIDIIARM